MQTYKSHLHIYGLHTSKESVLPSGGLLHGTELKRLDIYLQHSIQAAAEGLVAMALVGDSRFLLLGMSDGSCHLYSWQAKVSLPGALALCCAQQASSLAPSQSLPSHCTKPMTASSEDLQLPLLAAGSF